MFAKWLVFEKGPIVKVGNERKNNSPYWNHRRNRGGLGPYAVSKYFAKTNENAGNFHVMDKLCRVRRWDVGGDRSVAQFRLEVICNDVLIANCMNYTKLFEQAVGIV